MEDEDASCELELPLFIELKQSSSLNDLGTYSTTAIGADQFIGSFKGKTKKSMSQCGDSTYVWAILSSRQVPLFYIDASDPKDSNWLRFIRTTAEASKCNVICMQQNQQINYFTSKEIKQGDELLTFLPKKKKNRNKNVQNQTYRLVNSNGTHVSKIEESSSSSFSTNSDSNKDTLNEEPAKKKPKCESLYEETKLTVANMNSIKIQIEQTEAKSSNKYILTDLILSLENKYEKFKNEIRILKCNICPAIMSTRVTPDLSYLNVLKKHYLDTHLAKKTEGINFESTESGNSNSDETAVLKDLMNSMLSQVEKLFKNEHQFKCHMCDNLFYSDLRSLKSHLTNEHSFEFENTFSCLYCDKELTRISGLINHLKSSHKDSIVLNRLVSPVSSDQDAMLDSVDLQDYEELSSADEDPVELKTCEIENDDSNSMDSSLTVSSSSSKPDQKGTTNQDRDDKSKSEYKSTKVSNKSAKLVENNSASSQPASVKTWTCQMCKKQFEQRVDLSKHQCIELNLKLLKKKKDIRKKKWREAHWKRKIDLSYIETTSLTQLSQNIADNLSFCIDGTLEDLKACAREVKDYINTELGNESHTQMFLRNFFPDVYKKLATSPSALANLDTNLISKANSYFVDSIYVPSKNTASQQLPVNKSALSKLNNSSANTNSSMLFSCKNCRVKSRTLTDLVQHQRDHHKLEFKTTYDFYNDAAASISQEEERNCLNWFSSNMYANSPIGYFACDPFSYLLNLHWDQTLEKRCSNCQSVFSREKYLNHVSNCDDKKCEKNSD